MGATFRSFDTNSRGNGLIGPYLVRKAIGKDTEVNEVEYSGHRVNVNGRGFGANFNGLGAIGSFVTEEVRMRHGPDYHAQFHLKGDEGDFQLHLVVPKGLHELSSELFWFYGVRDEKLKSGIEFPDRVSANLSYSSVGFGVWHGLPPEMYSPESGLLRKVVFDTGKVQMVFSDFPSLEFGLQESSRSAFSDVDSVLERMKSEGLLASINEAKEDFSKIITGKIKEDARLPPLYLVDSFFREHQEKDTLSRGVSFDFEGEFDLDTLRQINPLFDRYLSRGRVSLPQFIMHGGTNPIVGRPSETRFYVSGTKGENNAVETIEILGSILGYNPGKKILIYEAPNMRDPVQIIGALD